MQNENKLKKVYIPVNETGQKIGEWHHRAKLSDRAVDLMLLLREEWGYDYKRLAWIFEVSVDTAKSICNYRRRSATVMGHRICFVKDED